MLAFLYEGFDYFSGANVIPCHFCIMASAVIANTYLLSSRTCSADQPQAVLFSIMVSNAVRPQSKIHASPEPLVKHVPRDNMNL